MQVLARLAAMSLAVFTIACGDSGGVNEPRSIAGTYTLQTFDNEPLPVVVVEFEGYKLEVTAANYVLASAGTYSNTASFRETFEGEITTDAETVTGVYTVTGTNVTFTDSEGEAIVGVISGNTLRFSEGGVTAVFVR